MSNTESTLERVVHTRKGKRPNVNRRSPGPNKLGPDISLEVASQILEEVDTPVSLSVFILLKYGEYDQIVDKSVDPLHYSEADRFSDDYLAVNLLRKAGHLNTSYNREARAIANFKEVEKQVSETNRRLIGLRWCPSRDITTTNLMLRAASICHQILGPSPNLASLESRIGFGSGASSSTSRKKGSAYFKSMATLDVSPQLQPHGHIIVNHVHPWASAALNADGPVSLLPLRSAVRGAKLRLVPKDAKTHRVIAVEPHINITIQRAIGQVMADKLARWGVDITDQRRNQVYAERGFSDGFSTIDLSNASDCVSIELCRWLLPPKWFEFLNTIRSHEIEVEGVWSRLEKFSTAGCGFTFPLETLLFLAICWAATGSKPKAVYGDDIIVNSEHFLETVDALVACGFSVNTLKSFSTGSPFRESCGEDFFLGYGVRPFFIRGPIRSLSDRIGLHNQIMRFSLRRTSWFGKPYQKLYPSLRRLRGKSRLLVPYDIGDAGFSSSFEDAVRLDGQVTPFKGDNPNYPNNQAEGFMVRALLARPIRQAMRRYYASLYQSFSVIASQQDTDYRSDPATGGLVPLGLSVEWTVKRIPVREWTSSDTFSIEEVPSLG